MLRKTGFATLQPTDLIKKQLAVKLKRLEQRIAKLTAEAEEIRTYLANVEASSLRSLSRGLRKNSLSKWAVRAHVRRMLEEHGSAASVKYLYAKLREIEPTLNKSTFRSHIKRMVDDRVIKGEGQRGWYWLVDQDNVSREREVVPTLRKQKDPWLYR